jgi:hypothetical protein
MYPTRSLLQKRCRYHLWQGRRAQGEHVRRVAEGCQEPAGRCLLRDGDGPGLRGQARQKTKNNRKSFRRLAI